MDPKEKAVKRKEYFIELLNVDVSINLMNYANNRSEVTQEETNKAT